MSLQYATAPDLSIDDPRFLQIEPLKRFYEKAPLGHELQKKKGKV